MSDVRAALAELVACNRIVKSGGARKVKAGRWAKAWADAESVIGIPASEQNQEVAPVAGIPVTLPACPFCGDADLRLGKIGMDGMQPGVCNNCASHWETALGLTRAALSAAPPEHRKEQDETGLAYTAGTPSGRAARNVIPREPTDVMIDAAIRAHARCINKSNQRNDFYLAIWRAMWDAANLPAFVTPAGSRIPNALDVATSAAPVQDADGLIERLRDQAEAADEPEYAAIMRESADALQAAQVEIARLREKVAEEQRNWALQFTARQRAEARAAELEKDAGRYQFIRAGLPGTYDRILIYAGATLDQAIDRARSELPEGK